MMKGMISSPFIEFLYFFAYNFHRESLQIQINLQTLSSSKKLRPKRSFFFLIIMHQLFLYINTLKLINNLLARRFRCQAHDDDHRK